MKYILLSDNSVAEIIPDFDPVFPNIPIERRYPEDFINKLIAVEGDVPVEQNWMYNVKAGTFSEPVVEPTEPITPEPVPHIPTEAEQLRADVDFLAAMGGIAL